MDMTLHKNYKNAVSRWSYSKLATYESCPFQFYNKYILKLKPFIESPAMIRGRDLHDRLNVLLRVN